MITFVYNPFAFKHGVLKLDIETAMDAALVDELVEDFGNKSLAVGEVVKQMWQNKFPIQRQSLFWLALLRGC
jgi:imidazoleglycerol phosphate dehydratase HisB